jgi:hypothetical protein
VTASLNRSVKRRFTSTGDQSSREPVFKTAGTRVWEENGFSKTKDRLVLRRLQSGDADVADDIPF